MRTNSKKFPIESCWKLSLRKKLKETTLKNISGGEVYVKLVTNEANTQMTIETYTLPSMVTIFTQTIDLETVENYLGYKIFAICPNCSKRIQSLYLRPGIKNWACRCSGLYYTSQSSYIPKGPLGSVQYLLRCNERLSFFLATKVKRIIFNGQPTHKALQLCKLEERLYSKTPYRL